MSNLIDRLAAEGIRPKHFRAGDQKMPCPRAAQCGARNVRDACFSLKIDNDGGATWQCHRGGCGGWSGNVPSERFARSERRQPERPVYKRPSYSLPPSPDENMIRWFEGRGISRETVLRAKVSLQRVWMPGPDKEVNAIAVPYFRNGSVVNVKYRDAEKNFRQEKDCEKILYGLDGIAHADAAIIVEGEIDALSFYEAGVFNVLSVPDGAPDPSKWKGGTEEDKKFSFLRNCTAEIDRLERVIIAVDNDAPGQLLAEELARRIGKEKCWRVTWPELNDVFCKDANDVLRHHGADVLREMIAQAEPYPMSGLARFEDHLEEILAYYDDPNAQRFDLGWQATRNLFKIAAGELYVITGVPNSGKSEWMENVMLHMARHHGWKFAIASFEHQMKKYGPRLAEKYLAMPFRDGRRARMGKGDLVRALRWWDERIIHIRADNLDEEPTLDWVLARAKAAVLRHGSNALIVDPFNELETQRPRELSEVDYLGKCLRKIKRFMWSHGIAVFIIAHPAKPGAKLNGDQQEINLYSISGGAMWFNKMDNGVVVKRLPFEPGDREYLTEIRVLKVKWKESGQIGAARLAFDPATGLYSDPVGPSVVVPYKED